MRHHVFVSALTVFAIVLLASVLYTFTRIQLYEGVARSDDLLPPETAAFGLSLRESHITYINCADYANGPRMLQRIAARITGEDVESMLSPYAPPGQRSADLLLEVLAKNRRVWTESPNGPIAISYRHPEPVIAARVTNMFLDELIQWTSRIRIDRMIEMVEKTTLEIAARTQRVDALAKDLDALSGSYQSALRSPEHRASGSIAVSTYVELQKELAEERQLLAIAKRREKEANILNEWDIRSVRRVDAAKPPTYYVYPSHLYHLSVGLITGLLAAAFTAWLCARRQTNRPVSEFCA